MSMKINRLEIENVKRIRAVRIEPTASGLTVIGGNNNQGKTSVLDALAWALGGESFRPSEATREGSAVPAALKVTMSNGLVVERKGKNGSLKVTDPSGKKAGQRLLDSFVEKLALNLPKFMESTGKEKADTLLRIIGINEELTRISQQEKELYNKRLAVGQIASQKEKYAKEQLSYPDAPKELLSPMELIRQQQAILARNGENQRKRDEKGRYIKELESARRAYESAKERLKEAEQNAENAEKSAENLQDESTAELEANIANIEEVNRKVRANMDKEKAEDDAKEYRAQYNQLTAEIEKIRKHREALLASAQLPLPGLSVQDGELVYNGQKWDNMSGSEQLKVSTAIVRKLNPDCGFVLLDKLEQMDLNTLREFGAWLESEGLQAIATRVSTGDECSVIIEDGYAGIPDASETTGGEQIQKWKAGVF
ncbi:MAG TPA: chromosome segregation protein SMC [Lachnospiraceae bacterium]|nr:chromosome segregation protein SMC [Lachnospiraceae bacterium]